MTTNGQPEKGNCFVPQSEEEVLRIYTLNTWSFLRSYCMIYSAMGSDFFKAAMVAAVQPGVDKVAVQELPNPEIGTIPGKVYRDREIIPLDKHILLDSVYDPSFSLLVVWGFDEVAKILPYWHTNQVVTIRPKETP